MDREKLEKWITNYENPTGPDGWIDPWTWMKEMKNLLQEYDHLQDEYDRLEQRMTHEVERLREQAVKQNRINVGLSQELKRRDIEVERLEGIIEQYEESSPI